MVIKNLPIKGGFLFIPVWGVKNLISCVNVFAKPGGSNKVNIL